jgi:hypothetical protein
MPSFMEVEFTLFNDTYLLVCLLNSYFRSLVLCKGRIQAGYGDLNYDALAKELHNCSKIDPKNALIWETIATMEVQL